MRAEDTVPVPWDTGAALAAWHGLCLSPGHSHVPSRQGLAASSSVCCPGSAEEDRASHKWGLRKWNLLAEVPIPGGFGGTTP